MKFTTFLAIAGIAAVIALFANCSQIEKFTRAHPSVVSSLERAVVSQVGALVVQYAETGKVNEACAINGGLQAVSSLAASTFTNAEAHAVIETAVTEYTGDSSPEGKTTAQKIATVIAAGLQAADTPQAKQQTVVAAGVAASSAATKAYTAAKSDTATN